MPTPAAPLNDTERKDLLRSYREVFRTANEGKEPPNLEWFNGWFLDLDSNGEGYGRYRAATLVEMRDRLLSRIAGRVAVSLEDQGITSAEVPVAYVGYRGHTLVVTRRDDPMEPPGDDPDAEGPFTLGDHYVGVTDWNLQTAASLSSAHHAVLVGFRAIDAVADHGYPIEETLSLSGMVPQPIDVGAKNNTTAPHGP